jgi:hypothetical protein
MTRRMTQTEGRATPTGGRSMRPACLPVAVLTIPAISPERSGGQDRRGAVLADRQTSEHPTHRSGPILRRLGREAPPETSLPGAPPATAVADTWAHLPRVWIPFPCAAAQVLSRLAWQLKQEKSAVSFPVANLPSGVNI